MEGSKSKASSSKFSMCKMLPVCFEESPMAILKENKQAVKQKKMCCKSPEAEPRNVGLNKEG